MRPLSRISLYSHALSMPAFGSTTPATGFGQQQQPQQQSTGLFGGGAL